MFAIRRTLNTVKNTTRVVSTRQFGASHGHGPHVPPFYNKLGWSCLFFTWVWIMYRAKQDKGTAFGLYAPWLEEHHHEPKVNFNNTDYSDGMPESEVEEHEEH